MDSCLSKKEIDALNKILMFWFGKPNNFEKWFTNGKKHDKSIKSQFKNILKSAEKGNLLHWLGNDRSYLAMIILLDQFSRYIYRDTKYAFKNDKKARLFMEMGLDLHLDKFNAEEKMFVLMPYQHSENLEDQKFGYRMLRNLIKKEKDQKEKNILKKSLYHQKNRLKIISSFKRFPSRNYILGREPSESEIDFLDEHDNYDYTY